MTKTKRGISILLMLTMLCSIFCISGLSVDAASTTVKGSCGTNATYTLNKSTGKMVIKAKSGKDGYVKDNFITSLSTANQKAVKTLVIKSGIVNIGSNAFANLSTLTKITIADTVNYYGASAFGGTGVKSISIKSDYNDEEVYLGSALFAGCTSLKKVTISGSATVWFYSYTFSKCSALKTVNISNKVYQVGDNAFSYCTSLTKITIPYLEYNISQEAFSNCTSLKKVVVKEVNTNNDHSLGYKAFYNCRNLRTFTGCKKFSTICNYALYNCYNLEKFNFNSKLTYIQEYAFYNCRALTTLSIPKKVKTIDKYAFTNCIALEKVTLYKSTTVASTAFKNCTCSFKYKS